MLGSGYPNENEVPKDCGNSLILEAIPVLQSADITFGNLEGAVINSGKPAKNCKKSNNCYAFRMKECAVSVLKNAGFDILNIANNHSFDFGSSGQLNTINTLENNNIKYCGLENYPTASFEHQGKKIAFIGFANSPFTLRMTKIEKAKELVSNLKESHDIVIVSFHGGAEGQKYKHITKTTEMFLGENRGNPHLFAHNMIDAGADLILGHGPHLPRAGEIYKNRLILYSLGNFCTYKQFGLKGSNAFAPIAFIELNQSGELINFDIKSFIQEKPGVLFPDANESAKNEIFRLSEIDFPDTGINKFKK